MQLQEEKQHKQAQVATNRPSYREARWERAVKNVHALGVTQELLQLFSLYGDIQEYRILDEYPCEPYTDVYWVKFVDINSARIAKKKVDNKSFFGKNLHVSYAPEFESVEDTREKLEERRATIAQKTKQAQARAQREKRIKEQQQQQQQQQQKTAETTRVIIAESPAQRGQATVNDPIQIPVTFDEPLSQGFPSQDHGRPSTSNLSDTHDVMLHRYQAPPLPPPSFHSTQSPQYPSQSADNIMGGVSPMTSSRGRLSTGWSNKEGNRRERLGKRQLGGEREEKSGHVMSGLTTSQRVSAFLSNSEAKCDSSAGNLTASEEQPERKKACMQPAICGNTQKQTRDATTAQSTSMSERTLIPSESYFPVPKLPPLQTGSKSIDTSIQTVRNKMNKVWDEAAHTPSIAHKVKKPKKRKRI